ncbi:MAG: hypothetical protein QOF88_5766 [Mycobacterium sp.]|nr:hypothetical protein [Mycobacterium sp.]
MFASQTTGYTRRLPVCTGGSPGHQRHGPDGLSSGQPGQALSGTGAPGRAWAVPGPTTPATLPASSTAVASPTTSRFTGGRLFPRELGRRGNCEIRFMVRSLIVKGRAVGVAGCIGRSQPDCGRPLGGFLEGREGSAGRRLPQNSLPKSVRIGVASRSYLVNGSHRRDPAQPRRGLRDRHIALRLSDGMDPDQHRIGGDRVSAGASGAPPGASDRAERRGWRGLAGADPGRCADGGRRPGNGSRSPTGIRAWRAACGSCPGKSVGLGPARRS